MGCDVTAPFTLTQTFPARFDYLDEIRSFVGQGAERAGFSPRQVYAVQMAADEACSNIIEHGYAGQPGEIVIHLEWDGEQLRLVFQDHGRSFNMSKVPKPDVKAPLSKRKVGGLGIYLIHQLMDEVHYHPAATQNTLILVKRRESGK